MENIEIAKSLFFLSLLGYAKIGGGYLVWLWIREGKSIWLGLSGSNCVGYLWSNTNLSARRTLGGFMPPMVAYS